MLARLDWKPAGHSHQKRLPKHRQAAILQFATDYLREGFPTVFAFEGSCRHGLRSGLCLEGWNWTAADMAASQAITLALSHLGAERPTWEQAQPEYTQPGVLADSRTHCINCYKPLTGHQRLFCSRTCKDASQDRRASDDAKAATRAADIARHARWSEKQPDRHCLTCGTAFKPKVPRQKYCCKSCFHRSLRQ
jgi:predicted nucleic acid-binding Zn ribbon protein